MEKTDSPLETEIIKEEYLEDNIEHMVYFHSGKHLCVCFLLSDTSQFKSLLDSGLQKVFRYFMVVFFFFFSS